MNMNVSTINEVLKSRTLLLDAHLRYSSGLVLNNIENACLILRMRKHCDETSREYIKALMRTVDSLPLNERLLPRIILERNHLLEVMLEYSILVEKDIAYFLIYATDEQIECFRNYVSVTPENANLIIKALGEIIDVILNSYDPIKCVVSVIDRCMLFYSGSYDVSGFKYDIINNLHLCIKYYYGQRPPVNFKQMEQVLSAKLYSLWEDDNRTVEISCDPNDTSDAGDFLIENMYDDLTRIEVDPLYQADHTSTFMKLKGG